MDAPSRTCRGDEGFCHAQQDVLRRQVETRHGRHLQNLSRQSLLHQGVEPPPHLRHACPQNRQSGTRVSQSWKGRMDRGGW